MTTTDELRKLLDERGVEWYEPTMKPNTTWFPDAYGINCRVKPWGDALCVKRYGLTPEQAITATLGGGRESYAPPLDVLLRCLENDYGIRASWDGLRRVWTTESVTAELDYIEDKSRWFELFGTPERAARTMHGGTPLCDICEMRGKPCDGCPLVEDYDALLEWLRGDAECANTVRALSI